ncbi:hypothetical protein L484_011866 [Morus notabilis]|uniref:Uncharacterized protein n=1 Tax=Morus notabilis TaxID=981085 RepID=W9SCF7_9ROSA|nr:hypothetical protein L484_011866 [Morus notabilis]
MHSNLQSEYLEVIGRLIHRLNATARRTDEKQRCLSRGVVIPALYIEFKGSLGAEKIFPGKLEFPEKIKSATGGEEEPGLVGAGREARARLSSDGEFDCER